MVWKNSKKTWNSNLIVMELCFYYGFELTFKDPASGNYTIKFYNEAPETGANNISRQIISLN